MKDRIKVFLEKEAFERFILNEDDAAPADSAEKKAFYEHRWL